MILGILQARASSSRFPGKVLAPILGEPMLSRQIERISRATGLDRLVMATSQEASDDPVASLCQRLGVEVFRGSLPDVLDRYYQAAKLHRPDHVVRMTGDCPLIDPEVIDLVIATHLRDRTDYTSNTLRRTYPDGLDVEAIRFPVLVDAWEHAETTFDREHVTPFIYRGLGDDRVGHVTQHPDLSAYRWTVDTPEDLQFVARVYEALYPRKSDFVSSDVLTLLQDQPHIGRING